MPEKGSIQSTSHVVNTSSLRPPDKDEESLKVPARKQTATGDCTRHNSPTLEQRSIKITGATSNVNQEKTQIASIEKQYISHCDRKAKLEEKKEVAQQLETIRRFITSPENFDEDCSFEIKFVSKSGKEETLLPPEKGLNPKRLKELLTKLGAQVDKFDEAFVKNGRDQQLDQTIVDEAEQVQKIHSKLEQEAPESKALSYQPQKARQYEFTVDLPDWPPAKAKEGFVINLNTSGSSPTTEHPRTILKPATRTILKPATPSLAKEPEPNSLELPGIENIRWLSPDAPLFLPNGYPQQEATATFINGSAGFALPEAAASKFEDSDVVRFQALHSKLTDQIQDGSSGMIPDDILHNKKITPACIRQCFCDNTGSMGTTFVHIFAGNQSPSPRSQGNTNNQVMVLWFPKEGLKATPEVAQQASLEVMEAFNKYQKKAFWYNERPADEGPSLAKDRLEYARFKKTAQPAKAESIKIGSRNRKIRTKDPEAPVALPIVSAARFCSLPHDALLETPTTEMDNRALQGFRTALIASQGKSQEIFQGTKFLKTLELTDRLSPPQPVITDAVTPLGSGIPKNEHSPEGKSDAELDAEFDAELDAALEINLKAAEEPSLHTLEKTKALKEATMQAKTALNAHFNNNQEFTLFSDESAKIILKANSVLQKSSIRHEGKQTPKNTGEAFFILINSEKDKACASCYAEGEEPAPDSGYAQKTLIPFMEDIENLLEQYMKDHNSLAGITDADVMNFVYPAFLKHKEKSLKGVSFNIILGINNVNWLINCGDTRALCIPHKNPEVLELQADNTDPDTAERLAKVIFGKDDITSGQLEATGELPVISKLPTGEEGGYYLLQTGVALSQLKPDIEQAVQKIVAGKKESQEEAIQQEIATMLSELSELSEEQRNHGIAAPKVFAFFPESQA